MAEAKDTISSPVQNPNSAPPASVSQTAMGKDSAVTAT